MVESDLHCLTDQGNKNTDYVIAAFQWIMNIMYLIIAAKETDSSDQTCLNKIKQQIFYEPADFQHHNSFLS